MKNVQNIKSSQVAAVIAAIPATAIFTVDFITTKNVARKMNCRSGVIPRYERKTDRPAPTMPSNMITVFDMQKREYRNFNMDTTFRIAAEGTIFNVVG